MLQAPTCITGTAGLIFVRMYVLACDALSHSQSPFRESFGGRTTRTLLLPVLDSINCVDIGGVFLKHLLVCSLSLCVSSGLCAALSGFCE